MSDDISAAADKRDFDTFMGAIRYAQCLKEENEALKAAGTGSGDGSVFHLRLLNGALYGTGFYVPGYNILATAWHVPEGSQVATQELVDRATAMFGASVECFRLRRISDERLYLDGAHLDVHLIGERSTVDAFIKAQPDPSEIEQALGMDALSFERSPSDPVVVTDGFSAGAVATAPQRRYLSPYHRIDNTGGLLSFWSSAARDEYAPGPVLGGYSGGRALGEANSFVGVVTRAGPDIAQNREVVVVQPIHSSVIVDRVDI